MTNMERIRRETAKVWGIPWRQIRVKVRRYSKRSRAIDVVNPYADEWYTTHPFTPCRTTRYVLHQAVINMPDVVKCIEQERELYKGFLRCVS